MKHTLLCLMLVPCALGLGAKPLAIVSASSEEEGTLVLDVCRPNRVDCRWFASKGDFQKEKLEDYAAIYLGEKLPKGFDPAGPELRSWVKAGGTLLAAGQETSAAVADFERGEGRIATFPASIGIRRFAYMASGTALGHPDAQGVYVRTPEGEELERLIRDQAVALLEAKDLSRTAETSEWDVKPLGAPGNIRLPSGFANKAVFRPAPVRAPGLVFRRGARQGVVVSEGKGTLKLAEELKYHLDRLCGGSVPVVRERTDGVPAIVLRELEDGARGRSVIRREGDVLFVEGRGTGLSHAVTYLLEALGCRYLWPGATGKVIPKGTEIVVPEIALDFVPVLKQREIRDYYVSRRVPDDPRFRRLGLDQATFDRFHAAERFDRPGNRDFWEWHGVNDGTDLEGKYVWNHYFLDYWQKYGKDHPDWFALQPNGSRYQDLGNRPERPCLCLSNEGLIEQVARDHIERFRREPETVALSVCLPDGGHPSPCMCAKCRALDPVNAAVSPFTKMYFGAPVHAARPYVALTDRVLWFANRVQERIRAACPGRKVTNYVYSNYIDPPVKVRPDPDLVLLSVAGEYVADMYRRWPTDNLSAWSRFGNMLFWRPNALWGFGLGLPQNFGRAIFNDIETFKANGIVGTDFDCMFGAWLTYGVVYYMTAKAQLNPDRLDYDTLLDDYCRAAYGPAACTMRAYYDYLEDRTEASVAHGDNGSDGVRRLNYRQTATYRLARNLDFAKLAAWLTEAEKAAAGDADVLARLSLQREALEYGTREAGVSIADYDRDPKADGLRNAYAQFVCDRAYLHPVLMEAAPFGAPYTQPLLRRAADPVSRCQPPKLPTEARHDLVPTPDNLRNSDGDFIRLKDGTILFAWSRFARTDDSSVHWDRLPSDIAAIRSTDGGRTWSEKAEILVRNDAQNVMSVSFFRFADGRIGLFYLRNSGLGENEFLLRTSADEGKSWSAPQKVAGRKGFLSVVNNARVIRLKSGRIVFPVSRHESRNGKLEPAGDILCVYSDDEGATWTEGAAAKAYGPDGKRVTTQEPGVVELKDGRLMVFARTNAGAQWAGYSSDGGGTIGPFAPTPLEGPLGPATLRRLKTGELVAIWNDHTGRRELGGKRTPLTIALSRDEGKTWTDRKVLEDAPTGFYCYTAFLEDGDDWLLAYCVATRKNLDTLRIVRLKDFR